ncbi:hypothetical protein Bbelb_125470 [Branchiostoma belcheri]|nr:hypothetical protein Bbelb_125470 [Branchiostoma belcheri]
MGQHWRSRLAYRDVADAGTDDHPHPPESAGYLRWKRLSIPERQGCQQYDRLQASVDIAGWDRLMARGDAVQTPAYQGPSAFHGTSEDFLHNGADIGMTTPSFKRPTIWSFDRNPLHALASAGHLRSRWRISRGACQRPAGKLITFPPRTITDGNRRHTSRKPTFSHPPRGDNF